jgi:EAL domain-containing protein (putative c-di-GMP-specific phosphodiesterase class I)
MTSLRARAEAAHGRRNALRPPSSRFLFYQPVVDAGSERLVGFEALLRWNSPNRAWYRRIISVAGRGNAILPIGHGC